MKIEKEEMMIIHLAEIYNNNPTDFIRFFESSLKEVSSIKKGALFFQFGNILFKYSYFILAVDCWKNAASYYIKSLSQNSIRL